MSETLIAGGQFPLLERYPLRREPERSGFDRAATEVTAFALAGWTRWRGRRFAAAATATARAAPSAEATDETLRAAARALSPQLRAAGWPPPLPLAAQAMALAREASARVLGRRQFDVQVMGATALISGMLAEMQTGEGKTLTAALASVTAGLAGVPVHVITSNDYLAARDAEELAPLYSFFGLSVGVIRQGAPAADRRAAYAADIVHCSGKEAAFDHLRDRLALRDRSDDLRFKLDALLERNRSGGEVVHRGLGLAIVDEADSVLIDEARTPLIISRNVSPDAAFRESCAHALAVARALRPDEDFLLEPDRRSVALTENGARAITAAAEGRDGPWRTPIIREELVAQALTALHMLRRDHDYILREDKVAIVDENTGRVMPDRSWSNGLHQFVEAKEGVPMTGERATLARLTFQRFFRRYRWLAGMTGTASPVARELWAVYGLAVATIPTHRPSRRTSVPERVFPTAKAKWEAVAIRAAALQAQGCAVLLGSRSVQASAQASASLTAAGVRHVVLNADQDADEAAIIARAGQAGAVTVATNLAGRGTDIRLGPGVAERGGLHVLMTERHDSARIDRQLAGRCARQGEPGQVEVFLSHEDELLANLPRLTAWRLAGTVRPSLPFTVAQRAAERRHGRMRRDLLRADRHLAEILAFTGEPE